MKAPFPWFGGKSRVAHIVWERFGNVANYVEPFAGSLAVLLRRPHWKPTEPWRKTETVNDKDCWLANFWRAVQADPERVAHYADRPVNECDITAMRRWIFNNPGFEERMKCEPGYFEPEIAGKWVWGVCCSIANSFSPLEPPRLPHLGDPGGGINRQLPHLGNPGRGINRQLPHLGNPGRGTNRRDYIMDQMSMIGARLRDVRVACGEWGRILTPTITERQGITGVFLDPPYDSDCTDVYQGDSTGISKDVAAWAMENAGNSALRIALCGYEGEHSMPGDWECVAWKAAGGYGSQGDGRGRDNANRERIWFSPSCINQPRQCGLFDAYDRVSVAYDKGGEVSNAPS